MLRPAAPPLALGLVVAPLLLAAETGLVYLLMRVTAGNVFGVIFLLGILVVSTVWGLRLGALTTLATAAVYVFFHHLQTGGSILAAANDWVAIGVFLIVALSAATLAGIARLRAREADRRRQEVEASHDELGVLAEHQAALRRVATLVARGATRRKSSRRCPTNWPIAYMRSTRGCSVTSPTAAGMWWTFNMSRA